MTQHDGDNPTSEDGEDGETATESRRTPNSRPARRPTRPSERPVRSVERRRSTRKRGAREERWLRRDAESVESKNPAADDGSTTDRPTNDDPTAGGDRADAGDADVDTSGWEAIVDEVMGAGDDGDPDGEEGGTGSSSGR